ncbi:unnamed protein product [Ranitomeya imitator]|uniref:Exonuclease domain-containing protein n=1 Tax=Ranitomeya imitator TaxID=111125 RepID=A0ABN9LWW4_9NEOB|nr:unnamed protein product [Ranitomeya imitator]
MARKKQRSKEKRVAIITLRIEGQSVRKIGQTLKVSPSAVAKTIKRYKETGSHEDGLRKGRLRVTSVSEDKFIRVTSLRNRRSWDMSKFLNMQCHISEIKYPRFAKKWCNIRKCYGNFYKVPRNQTKLTTMLEKLGMRYDGRLHSGLDDSKNIARIAIRLLQDGCELRMNERLHAGQLMTISSSLPLEGAAVPQNPQFKN